MRYLELESERLRFRKFRREDFPVVYDWLSSAENMKYRSSDPKTRAEACAYLDWAISCAEAENCVNFRYAVELKDSGQLIGSCELYYTDRDPAELAWELHRNYWRNGYGTEIGKTLLKLGFGTLGLRRIIADCNVLNTGSWKIMEAIGMRREAHYVKSYRGNSVLNHEWCDKYQYAILREEWETMDKNRPVIGGNKMERKGIQLDFTVSEKLRQFLAEKDGMPAALCEQKDGRLSVSVWYDFRPEPLTLACAAEPGDEIRVVLFPWRIELYRNGRLEDEEWPCGGCLLEGAVFCPDSGLPSLSETEEPQEPLPSVLGSFTGAEGWKPEENVFVGDCMPYCWDGRYHVLYLKDRHHHQSKWGKGAHQWAHISTADFQNWEIHPMAVEIDDPAEGSICTGSWIAAGKRQYLYYTVRMCDGSSAPICRSVSEDGYHFEKDRAFSFHLSSRYTGASARDPKVVQDKDGLFHMFVTTSLAKEEKGCLAHLVSADMEAWKELEPIYIAPNRDEPECSDYLEKDGWYYLIFSLCGKGLYRYSREPFSGWQEPENPEIPCKTVPKQAVWKGRILFAGFDGDGRYGGTMTFAEAEVCPDGQLSFKK